MLVLLRMWRHVRAAPLFYRHSLEVIMACQIAVEKRSHRFSPPSGARACTFDGSFCFFHGQLTLFVLVHDPTPILSPTCAHTQRHRSMSGRRSDEIEACAKSAQGRPHVVVNLFATNGTHVCVLQHSRNHFPPLLVPPPPLPHLRKTHGVSHGECL